MSYQPILNPELFFGSEVVLSDDVHHPETLKVEWAKGRQLSWKDIIDMLLIGITDIPVVK